MVPSRASIRPLREWLYATLLLAGIGTALTAQVPSRIVLEDWAENDYILSQWTIGDGLPQNSVLDIMQTPDGFLWLATFGGLARFDGVTFRVFDATSRPRMPDTRVTALAQDSSGLVYIGYQSGQIATFDGHAFHTDALGDSSRGVVWDLGVDHDGNVWASWESGLGVRTPSGRSAFSLADSLGRRPLQIYGDTVWVGLPEGGVASTTAERVLTGQLPEQIIPVSDPHVAQYHRLSGADFVSHRSLLRQRGGRFVRIAGQPGEIADVLEAADGSIWTVGRYVQEYPASILLADTPPRRILGGEEPPYVEAALVDREGNIWLGTTSRGLARIRPKRLQLIYPGRDAPDESVWTLLASPQHGLLIQGSCDRGTLALRDGTAVPTSIPCHLRPLVLGERGTVWTTSPGTGLLRWNRGLVDTVPEIDALTLAPHPSGYIFAASERELALVGDDSLHFLYRAGANDPTIPADLILVESETPDNVWLAGAGGVARYSDGTLERFGDEPDAPPPPVRGLYQTADGSIWFGSYGAGLTRYVNGRFTRFTGDQGLADNFVLHILSMAGSLWLNGNRSMSAIPVAQFDELAAGTRQRLDPIVFDAGDGFVEGNGQQSGAARLDDGRLAFATIAGVMVVDPTRRLYNNVAPGVMIEQFTAGDSVYEREPGMARVPPGQSGFRFSYTATSVTRPDKVRFRYQLEGLDEDWIDGESERSAFYPRVPPGRYVFRVTAANDMGLWNPVGATYGIEVLAPFWATPVFRAAAVSAVLLLLYALHRYRLALMRSRAAALQREIDQRKQAESERASLETQLQQSQRLEAVGRLTGGIAHDFNNLLTVILGNLDMVLTDTKELDAGQRSAIEGASKAANRGASLTQRLLAFSRRQPLQPGTIDLRHLLGEMDELFGRTLGGAIRISVQTADDLWPCLADRAQLENALLNLAINARDAMPNGGDLSITTSNIHVEPGQVFGPETAGAGQYVEITVTDTGTGMTPEVLARSLDPFFTTKPAGQGSGLGLSMVYGFVRQSGGYLTIESESGHGTTVRVLLPRSGQPSEPEPVLERRAVPGTGGQILVVEDSPEVLKVTVRILKRLGYDTVSATSVDDAIARMAEGTDLSLVLTDVVLSGRSGVELGNEVARRRPGTPVVYMSGYSGDVLAKDGRLPHGVELIQKPFRPEDLGARLAAVLARHRRV